MEPREIGQWGGLSPRRVEDYDKTDGNFQFRRFGGMNAANKASYEKKTPGYKVYGWQPPSVTKNPAPSTTEFPISPDSMDGYDDPFVYIDPDNFEVPTIPIAPSARPAAEAKKVCGQISKLLRDKESSSRGSRMFQKRRKRAAKFTTVGYGTQPPENDRYSEVPDDETSSEELSRLDFSSEDEIPAYDLPNIHNVLQDNLNPTEKIVQKQFKNLAMDVGSMRGKGAKIFAKRQQRMENYVITDENRRQPPPRPVQYEAGQFTPKDPTTAPGPYVRPGSSIAIAPKSQYKAQKSFNKPISGYCTDMEDDYTTSYQPQLNYFSDCEGSSVRGRSRRTRPVDRRGYESEAPQQKAATLPNHIDAGEDTRPPIAPFRRVMPPGKSQHFSPSGHGSRDSSLSRTSVSPARDNRTIMEDAPAPKRVWTRVIFNPRKPAVPQTKVPQSAAVGYPCDKTQSSPAARTPVSVKTVLSRGPSQSPQRTVIPPATSKPPMPSFYQQPQQKPENLPATFKPTQIPVQSSVTQLITLASDRENGAVKSKYPTAASLLEKPMEPEPKVDTSTAIKQNLVEEAPDFVGEGVAITQLSGFSNDFVPSPETPKEKQKDGDDERPSSPASVASYVSSSSSNITSTLPSRCLTPPNRTQTPPGTRVIKIASNGQPKPAVSSVKPASPLVRQTSAPNFSPSAPTRAQASNDTPTTTNKISACLKVLDPTKTLYQPKKPTQFQPSATLSALLQSESEPSYGTMKTPAMSYEYPCKKVSEPSYSPPVVTKTPSQKPATRSYQTLPTRSRSQSAPRGPPQPLGMIAEGMKGKGAKMFEKQLRRMERYTKETSQDDYPELQSPRSSNSSGSPVSPGGRFSYTLPRMAGFSPSGEKLVPGSEVKNGMRDVMGEFQKNTKPGKVKRPSETKKRGRDPLYYQQQLFYSPPSADDFVQPPPEAALEFDPVSETSSVTSSKASSLSSFNTDPRGDFLPQQTQESTFVTSPTASGTSFGADKRASVSSSSMSSQKSVGPKTAPKPPRTVIERQLSKPSSPVSASPTPEVFGFSPSTTSSENIIKFNGVETEKGSKCIENLIERIPDDHRNDGSNNEGFVTRRRTLSIESRPTKNNSSTSVASSVPSTLQPPSYSDVMSSSMPDMKSSSENKSGLSSFGSEGDVAKASRISTSKPKFNIRKNGVQVQMWKPGQ